MPLALLQETCHETSTCLEIAEAGALDSPCQGQGACRRLRRIENSRCGLAILRAVTRRCLLGWQHQMLGDISLILYRVSRHCHAWGCAADPSGNPAANHGCDRRGDLLFEQLEAIISESLKQMNRGCRIDRELIRIGQIGRGLSCFVSVQAPPLSGDQGRKSDNRIAGFANRRNGSI
jgi:hypothetical protein